MGGSEANAVSKKDSGNSTKAKVEWHSQKMQPEPEFHPDVIHSLWHFLYLQTTEQLPKASAESGVWCWRLG